MSAFKKPRKTWWIFFICLLVLLNVFAAQFHRRIDLTDEKRFTLSLSSKKLLRNLNGVVEIQVFLTGSLPAGFKKLAASTEDFLKECQETAGNTIQFSFKSAEQEIQDTEKTYADTLAALNASPINLKVQLKSGEQSQFIYPFALIHYHGNIQVVNLFPGAKIINTAADINSAEALLEYNLLNGIQSLARQVKPMVAYSTGNGEPTGLNTFDLVENVLRKDYNVFTINLNTEPVIPDTFRLLMIVKPTIPFTETEKIKIDQYIMGGGKVIWCIDRLEAEMDSLRLKNQIVAYDRELNLQDQLFRYGVRINPDLLMDLQCDFLPFDVSGSGQFEFLHWNYFPLFESRSGHPINKGLGLTAGRFVNSIDTVQSANVLKTILIRSSANSRLITAPALISGQENRNAPEDEQFKRSNTAAAVLLEGDFTSLYANRISSAAKDSLQKYGQAYRAHSLGANKMIVISDGDFVLNGVSQNVPLPMGVNPFTAGTKYEYKFANRDFIQNCFNYLINDAGLTEAKAKDYTLRLLDPKKTNEQRTQWQFINIVLPALLIGAMGAFYQFWRKKAYKQSNFKEIIKDR